MTNHDEQEVTGHLVIGPIDQVRNVEDLHPHPLQHKICPNLLEAKLECLLDDIFDRGMLEPIVILPDLTIVAGHQRWRAAKRLGYKTVPCRVNFVLAASEPHDVAAYMVRDNLWRRQMMPLAQVRACLALAECQPKESLSVVHQAREEIARQLGLTVRQTGRLMRLLVLPRAIQDAVDAGELSQPQGVEISYLPPAQQQEIAECALHGDSPAEIAAKYLARLNQQDGPGAKPEAPASLASCLEELQRRYAGQIDEADDKLLQAAVGVLRSLPDQASTSHPSQSKALAG